MIERLKPQIERALPKHVTPDRLARVALTAIRNNPRLQQAEPMSLMGSIITSAQLGLEPNTPLGQCYIIPYKNGKTGRYDAQFQMGYKGLIDLAHRSKQYKKLVARAVDEADEFDYAYGLDEFLHHKPARQPKGNSTYYYAMYELDNGGRSFVVWSREAVEAHAKRYSKSYDKNDSPWKTAFDQMAKKTVLIDLLRYAPKAVELVADPISKDGATLRFDGENEDEPISAEFELESESPEE
jgi:recombination protein RecT